MKAEIVNNPITESERMKKAFGQVIASRRIKCGMEQREFSRMAGVSNSHLRKIEVGETSPTLTTIVKLASALDTDASDLVIEAYDKMQEATFQKLL